LQQPLGEAGILEDRAEQDQAAAGIFVLRQIEQRLANLRVCAETFRAIDQPQVELVFKRAQVLDQLVLNSLRVVHEVTRMHFEKTGQQHARSIRQMRASAAFNLREIGLANSLAQLFFDCPHDFLLCHLALESAQRALDLAQIPDLFSEPHIAICN
jgi:hypothetical protein